MYITDHKLNNKRTEVIDRHHQGAKLKFNDKRIQTRQLRQASEH